LVLLLGVAAFLAVAATIYFYSSFYVIDSKEIGMKLVVADFYGFDLNPKNLTFGATFPGGSTRRDIFVQDTYGQPVHVKIIPTGELAPYVGLEKRDLTLQPGERVQIQASATAPEDSKKGTIYYGKLKVIFTRVW